ncbi:hypothetical protein BST81_26510 [Leptolyngbya sp. 'hensonii']|uniref:DUF1156 domain-containing protein n=1 Tax=Leptolyngbya sp. 'hensonii' TaxID=1922337 RepID=UPI00094FF532|nr:DUF1156 domain-containing protein [Leptolyngbya sp. 'hensonii']OLP15412.1 hypothetical protein BST81_26510 [Leptolyngbya sp. 'hensonii']
MTYRKKLIEVALPLEAINMESAREKSIRHGHPSTLHLWWARRPLAACRAILWASLVDDPSSWPDKFPTEEDQNRERQRLFDILGRIVIEVDKKGNQKQVVRGLVSWDEVNDPKSKVLEVGQREIARCLAWDRGEEPPTKPDAVREYIAKYAPPAYDPFAGGGSIPLEAQRLGLEAHASDLNPVAVLINKALIEIPPKFKDEPPVNPEDRKQIRIWKGAQGLAADVRYYGKWMRDEAFKRIGHFYPNIELPKAYDSEGTVIAWLWARTVRCPNPICSCQMPLVRSFALSTKTGKENWVEPIIDRSQSIPVVRFNVRTGYGDPSIGTVNRKGANCVACNTPVSLDFVRSEGKAGRLGVRMMAVVAEGKGGRIYLPPNEEHEKIAASAKPKWEPTTELPEQALGFRVQGYGMTKHSDLFSQRQLLALTTFSDLVKEAIEEVKKDGSDTEYANAVATYLGLSIGRCADFWCTFATWSWQPKNELVGHAFGRQAIPMTWDYGEINPFSNSGGNFTNNLDFTIKALEKTPATGKGTVQQCNAVALQTTNSCFSTDPPYYDNVPYADLSDFFYIWMRPTLASLYPDVLSTVLVPKAEELVAEPFRHGGKDQARRFFEDGMKAVFDKMRASANSEFPTTVYYAFKQSEDDERGSKETSIVRASTGWETMLEGLMSSGWQVNGTLPVRTERTGRLRDNASNALASSIVLVCRPRSTDALKITRRQFLTELKRELPRALKTLQQGNVAPVDLAQASIGPGMAVFSQYAAVLENDGSPMRVRTALQLINQILDEFLTEQEGEFDGDTRWALTWFEQYQFEPGQYGDAETLSKAKNTSVQGMVDAGILEAKGGKVRLLKRSELKSDWNPNSDSRMPDWEIAQYLIHELDQKGEMGAAELLAKLGNRGEIARDLAYRLYSLCDRKGWAQEGIAYNSLVISWPEITRLASEFTQSQPVQSSLF